jgi:hypothetical protein
MPFVSIQLNSNRPQQIALFFDSIETTADAPEDVEVLLHIDEGDAAMEAAVAREQAKRRFSMHILRTRLVQGYDTLWKPLNPLFEMTHPEAYFVLNVSDEMLFQTHGWDSILRRHAGYYPDHIFRLRASQFRFHNYTDVWECGSAPDSIAFHTRRWLELSGDWCPCLGPDNFQQCVAFYLFTSDPFLPQQLHRDMPLPDLRFTGEGQGTGLAGEARWKRTCVNIRAWFVLMSHPVQQEARRRAMRMKCHILTHGVAGAQVAEDEGRKCFTIRNAASRDIIESHSYRLSRLRIAVTNLSRIPFLLYYNGSRKRYSNHKMRDCLFMAAASCALFLAAQLPYSVGGKLLARAERLFRR